MLANIARIAIALERISVALEQHFYGITGEELRKAREQLAEMEPKSESFRDIAAKWREGNVPDPDPKDEIDA